MGNDIDNDSGAIKCPITMANGYALPLRMRQHNENALKVVQWLEAQPRVSFAAYPGLESHKGYETARRQIAPSFGGVLSFGLKADHDTHNGANGPAVTGPP